MRWRETRQSQVSLFCPRSVSGGTRIRRMNFLPAVPACHVVALFAKVKAQRRILGDRPFNPPDAGPAASLPAKQSITCRRGRPLVPTGKMSVLRHFSLRRSCAKARVLRAVPLSARDELVRRMKSEIVLQFSPEPIDGPIFLGWAGNAGDERYWRSAIMLLPRKVESNTASNCYLKKLFCECPVITVSFPYSRINGAAPMACA